MPLKLVNFVLQTGRNDILNLYPSLNEAILLTIKNALCPFIVNLPKKLEKEIHQVTEYFMAYKKETASKPWDDSVLNSLDFHYSSNTLKIIEANTNASGFLLSNLLLDDQEEVKVFEDDILKSFKTIFKNDSFKHVFIVDKFPETEKMFAEFLMFQDFFKRNGTNAEIIKTSKVYIKHDPLYIYNRDTDFYLEENPVLRFLWETKKIHLSTSPFSYENLANKKFNSEQNNLLISKKFNLLKKATLQTLNITDENKEDLWVRRKKLFFKPFSSFGSKGVYSGKSVSRKKFDVFNNEYLAQEFHPPGKIKNNQWKFDIRAFFSENGVQKIIARVYQGQLTNFFNLGGGFALIKWVD